MSRLSKKVFLFIKTQSIYTLIFSIGLALTLYTQNQYWFGEHSNKKLSELRSVIPVYYSTPEMRMEAKNDEEKFIITKKAVEYFTSNFECITVDGVRIKFDDGWGLVRSSNTQPVIVCRFEANSIERRDEIMEIVLNKLREFGELRLGKH